MERRIECFSLTLRDAYDNIYSFEKPSWFGTLILEINESKREARVILESWGAPKSVSFISDFMSYQYEEVA